MRNLWIRAGALVEGLRGYHFELRHLTVLLIVLILFQLILSFVQRNSIAGFLSETQNMYQQDAADRLANLTATSLELIVESSPAEPGRSGRERSKIIRAFNILFSQQSLQQNVEELCLLVDRDSTVVVVDDGRTLYSVLFEAGEGDGPGGGLHATAARLYDSLRSEMRSSEQIRTVVEKGQTFHTLVPFVPRGEYMGALYMRNTPDLAMISRDVVASYGRTSAAYFVLILFGVIAMYYVSSYTLRERNEAQQMLFEEQKRRLAEQIKVQNELLFTKRIYHAHHKAEKVMGFIKDDLRQLTAANIGPIRERISKYASFIARVIYDMKWYDPPLQTIRGPLFSTQVNDTIRFIVDNIFRRVARGEEGPRFTLDLDEALPPVAVNEFVVWEVLEPLIQNSLEHGGNDNVLVTIRTAWDASAGRGMIQISDRGRGIETWLLERDTEGVRQIFREHTSTKKTAEGQQSGYGCYLAYEIARQRCGWEIDAENAPEGGSRFTITFSTGAKGG